MADAFSEALDMMDVDGSAGISDSDGSDESENLIHVRKKKPTRVVDSGSSADENEEGVYEDSDDVDQEVPLAGLQAKKDDKPGGGFQWGDATMDDVDEKVPLTGLQAKKDDKPGGGNDGGDATMDDVDERVPLTELQSKEDERQRREKEDLRLAIEIDKQERQEVAAQHEQQERELQEPLGREELQSPVS